MKLTLEKVRKLFEDKGYIMTAMEYKDSKTPINYICPKHPDKDLKITYNKLRQGQGCKYCGYESQGSKKRISFAEVSLLFEDRGYQLASTEYKDVHTPLQYICMKHPDKTQNIGLGSLKQGHGCKYCGIESSVTSKKDKMTEIADKISKAQRTPYSEIKAQFEARGYVLITSSAEYKNSDTRVRFICPSHPDDIASVLVQTFINRGAGCNFCAIDIHRGENHHNWNPNLTEEEREANKSRHTIPEYKQWLKAVFKKDNYTCQKCGEHGGVLNAHHKDGYHWSVARRFDVTNGATLCKDCHTEFHNKYGRKDNTEEQYKEWLK